MTLNNLYRRTLEKLQVVAEGEAADPGDVMLIASKYASLYDMLSVKGLVSWSVEDDLPDFSVIPITSMLAYVSAAEFGIDSVALATEGALDLPQVSLAERQLRSQMSKTFVSYPAQSEYF